MIAKQPRQYQAFKISPGDTNRLALVFDPIGDKAGFVFAIEIFDIGGQTPPNEHRLGHEMFFVLRGQGVAHSNGKSVALSPGDSLFLPPGTPHEIENIGTGRLYCLTFMAPDDSFAALIRGGEPVALDAEDIAVIQGFNPGESGVG
ncbi:MAG: TonB box-like protein [Rhodospirillales bacterium]|nr:TonB box-like protein [Rhodospirillales bacterium]